MKTPNVCERLLLWNRKSHLVAATMTLPGCLSRAIFSLATLPDSPRCPPLLAEAVEAPPTPLVRCSITDTRKKLIKLTICWRVSCSLGTHWKRYGLWNKINDWFSEIYITFFLLLIFLYTLKSLFTVLTPPFMSEEKMDESCCHVTHRHGSASFSFFFCVT